MTNYDNIFEAYHTSVKMYMKPIIEKDVTDNKYSIYITCKMSKDVHSVWKALVHNLSEADEVESDPHCTFLWAKLDAEYDADKIFELLKPSLEDVNFELNPIGFHIFNGVSGDTQDCLVVKLDAPGHIIQLQDEVKYILNDNNIELQQDWPEWSPHMTIAYYPKDNEIHRDQPTNGMLSTPIATSVDYMILNSGDQMDFN